ncbi:MAG: 2-C-methyl-D-erythritol 4-phosphate cytidylyltransferase [Porticoccaceae bacterium]|nr:2-C-methyl-D-erythritol 4-phosphate cytidylyltransferase [Porticoccaceae bacterium]
MTGFISKIWAIVPAAGQGQRFSDTKPKQFFELNGQLIAEHSLSRLLAVPQIEQIIVPSDIDCIWWSQVLSIKHSKTRQVKGGEQRAHSVLNGILSLTELASDNDWVLVHDIARPCVTKTDINQLIMAVKDHPVGGILTAKIEETVKQVALDNHISATVDRTHHRLAQTPQMFRYGLLKHAISACLEENIIPTDEAFAIEHAGLKVLSVEGRRDNIKITRQEDLPIASAIINSQEV